jgi:hypothetical protein
MTPNNNNRCSLSYTADFSAITHHRKVVVTPFERGDSQDYAYVKIFPIGFKMAVKQVNQRT